jgi:hypothetical protein
MWKDTLEVGCGMTSCKSVDPFGKSGTLVVCNYGPPYAIAILGEIFYY